MNLISNAIDALEEHLNDPRSPDDFQPAIQIRTTVPQANLIAIHIADNGTGIRQRCAIAFLTPSIPLKPPAKAPG
jgi:C4-dicarboxylate-specific signal transduction histidine kinase